MIYTIDEKSEKEFSDWMESISFVDKDFNPLPVKLTKDISEDLEDDRQ